jgi:creatinine amidohydrolase
LRSIGYVRDGWQTADHSATDRRHLATVGMSAYTDSGVIGYPSRASAEKGRAVIDHLGKAAADQTSCRATGLMSRP